ncbi:MAG: VWA domain-containing protein [Acidobacteria bacterium]|nr:VWA domain-containing protein [Acidobacteriota bacterium]
MKFVTYKKFQPGDLDSLDMQELVNRLADFFLQSGFSPAYDYMNEMDEEQTLEQLRQAILDAIQNGELFSDEEWQKLMEQMQNLSAEQQQEVAERLMERLEEEGYISVSGPPQPSEQQPRPGGGSFGPEGQVRFELTDKSLDFLGFKTLKDLLASLGRSSFGRHDTRDLSTGIESGGASRRYEYGDTINLDVAGTLAHAIQREGSHIPLNIEYQDLMVHQTEYQSSCATVLMLDCSHSMILYGEDRFTPAKRVALALSHLIRTQYPGDSLHLILFHDSAEEMPLSQLARVQVGPYYTNTREGLRLARRVLERQKKDMRQIIMITDGKPSALTLEDGRIYKNAFGLDPLVVTQTLEEVAKCKRAGILINTFMLASDTGLVHFVQKVTELCRGKAYFTTPYTLGQYLLMDYVNRKTRTIH